MRKKIVLESSHSTAGDVQTIGTWIKGKLEIFSTSLATSSLPCVWLDLGMTWKNSEWSTKGLFDYHDEGPSHLNTDSLLCPPYHLINFPFSIVFRSFHQFSMRSAVQLFSFLQVLFSGVLLSHPSLPNIHFSFNLFTLKVHISSSQSVSSIISLIFHMLQF